MKYYRFNGFKAHSFPADAREDDEDDDARRSVTTLMLYKFYRA
jgi:hypothetical protein